MKIGLAGASMMLVNWKDGIKAAAELGYDAYEIFGEFPQTDPDLISRSERASARRLASRYGIEIAVHAPFNSLNLAAFNRCIREESVRQSIEAVKFCHDLGGRTVVIHNGEYTVDPTWGEAGKRAMGIQWDLNVDSLKRIAEVAEKLDVFLCLENCNFVPAKMEKSLADLKRIKKQVDSNRLKFTLDIGHSRLAEGVPTAIKTLGSDIRHIHFTDNFGKSDDHLVIGKGNFNYNSFRNFVRNFKYIVTLEVIKIDSSREPARESLENFRKIILR